MHRWVWGIVAGAGGLLLIVGVSVGVFVTSAFRGPRPAMAAAAGPPSPSMSSALDQILAPAEAMAPAGTGEARPALPRAELPADVLFARSSPSVVRIVTRDEDFHVTGFGSGFFVSDDGLIVTNFHVIRGAVFASVVRDDNSTIFVEGLVATVPAADLALLKVTGSGLPALAVGEATPPKIGTKVYAIGNPEGLTNTLSEGLISGVRSWSEGVNAIQTTAPISHGSIGGPLLTADGTVVGVTAAFKSDGQSLNFAIAAAAVQKLIDARGGGFTQLASADIPPLTPAQTRKFNEVWAALDRRQFDDAGSLLQAMADDHTADPVYWLAAGLLESARNHQAPAVKAFRAAIDLNPKFQPAWIYLGVTYAKYKLYDQAIDALEEVRRLNPGNSTGCNLEGSVYALSGRMDKALKCFVEAAVLDPKDAVAQAGVGHAFCGLRQYSAAVEPCRKAIALRPGYPRAYVDLGIAYSQLGRGTEATACWRTAARMDPDGAAGREARERLLVVGPGSGAAGVADSPAEDSARQHQAALDAVSLLHLQSVGTHNAYRRCKINGMIYNEGDLVEGCTIEKIGASSVIVRKGMFRFELTMNTPAPGH